MTRDIIIHRAVLPDLDAVKRLADENRESLGFLMRSALVSGIPRDAQRANEIVSPHPLTSRRGGFQA